MKWLTVLALFYCLDSWGATKYVSPDGSALWANCTTTATPCSLETAVSSAAAGDVVILMDGTYSTGINTSAAGTLGNLVTWQAQNSRRAILAGYASGTTDRVIQVDSAYHSFDGIAIAVQTGPGAANTYGLFVSGATYTEFKNGEIYFDGDEATMGVGNIAYCAQIRSVTVFTGNHVHDCTYGLSIFNSTASFIPTVSNNTFERMTIGDYQDSDCIAVSSATSYDWSGLIIEGNICSGYRDDGVDLLYADNVVVQDNIIHSPIADADDNSACLKLGYEGSNGNVARRNYCYELNEGGARNYGATVVGASSAVLESNIFVGGYRCMEFAQRSASGGADNLARHNTCVDFSDYGAYVYSGATGTVLQNNILDGATADIVVASTLTATGANNRRVNGTTSIAGTYNQTGDTDGEPGFTGGTSPTTASDFKLLANSPLRRAGVALNLGNIQDNGNRAFAHPPSIGAWEATSGDAASARTAR